MKLPLLAVFGIFTLILSSCSKPKEVAYSKLPYKHNLFVDPDTDKPFTGIARDLYADGRPKGEFPMKDGKFHGLVKEWYANGSPKAETQFVDGERTGHNREWMEDGRLYRERDYDHDHIVNEKNYEVAEEPEKKKHEGKPESGNDAKK